MSTELSKVEFIDQTQFLDRMLNMPNLSLDINTPKSLSLNPTIRNTNKNLLLDINSNEMEINKPYKIDDDLAIIKTADDQIYIVDIETDSQFLY